MARFIDNQTDFRLALELRAGFFIGAKNHWRESVDKCAS